MESEETKETTPLQALVSEASPTKNEGDLDLSNLSKTQLVEMVSRIRLQNNDLKRQIKRAKDTQAKISNQGEVEEEFISNKLVQKLEKV